MKFDMKTEKGLVHFIANCENCDWLTECHVTGQRRAAYHVKKTGHTINFESGYNGTYRGIE